MFQAEVIEKIKTYFSLITFIIYLFIFENCAMFKNIVEPSRPQMTIRRMRFACWIAKDVNTLSEYVILIDLPVQQWLHECASLLRSMYIACLVFTITSIHITVTLCSFVTSLFTDGHLYLYSLFNDLDPALRDFTRASFFIVCEIIPLFQAITPLFLVFAYVFGNICEAALKSVLNLLKLTLSIFHSYLCPDLQDY